MNHEQLIAEATTMGRWEKHRFMVLVGATIIISLMLVGVALTLYNTSGAAQLDLSRPGYVSVREQVDSPASFKGFPSTGTIDREALEQFNRLYERQAQQATTVDSFGGEVMTDEALSIADPDAATKQ